MFHFPSFASHDYVFIIRYLPYGRWVSPFRNLRITGYLPPPRSLSQAITSFIASDCQGIHHMHLITWLYNPKQSLTSTSDATVADSTASDLLFRELNHCTASIRFIYQNAWFSLIASNSFLLFTSIFHLRVTLLCFIKTSMNNLFQLKYILLMINCHLVDEQ